MENEYKDYNLVLATTFGMPIGASHVRTKMKQIIKNEGLPKCGISQPASYIGDIQAEN